MAEDTPTQEQDNEDLENDSLAKMIDLNYKRAYDEYQDAGVEAIKRSRTLADIVLSNAANQSAQVLQGGITHAASLNSQAIRHADLAVNKQWNLEPSEAAGEAVVLRSVTIDDASLKALGVAIAATVIDALKKTEA